MTTPSERALPPLPEPERRLYDPTKPNGRASSMDYTAEEMRAYAQKGMKQERALWELAASSQEIEFAAPVAPPVEPTDSCQWHQDDDGLLQMSCSGDPWVFEDGGVVENKVRFCMNCGKPVSVGARSRS